MNHLTNFRTNSYSIGGRLQCGTSSGTTNSEGIINTKGENVEDL